MKPQCAIIQVKAIEWFFQSKANSKSFQNLELENIERELNTKRHHSNITVYDYFTFISNEYLAMKNAQLRNRKHVPCFYRVIQTRVEVWEKKKCCGNTSRRRVFPQLFRVLPNFHKCLYNSTEARSTCFLFLLENNATRKRKTTC